MKRKIIFKKLGAIIISALVLIAGCSPLVYAQELTITDNGTGSSSDINVQNQAQTLTTQTNTADINNSVENNANTGGNIASDNSGGNVSIQTGDASINTQVINDVNSSVVDNSSCCNQNGINANISGNGDGSTNSINFQNTNFNAVNSTNTAIITNSINSYVNTGNNSVNGNSGGGVSIKTGDANINILVRNIANMSIADVSCCKPADPGNPPAVSDDPGNPGSNPGSGNGSESSSSGNTSGSSNSSDGGSNVGGQGGVLGLSNTSSSDFQAFLLILGLNIIALGAKLVLESKPSFVLAKVKNLR